MRSAAGTSCDDDDGGAQVRAIRPLIREPLTSSPSDAHELIYEALEGQWGKRTGRGGQDVVHDGMHYITVQLGPKAGASACQQRNIERQTHATIQLICSVVDRV